MWTIRNGRETNLARKHRFLCCISVAETAYSWLVSYSNIQGPPVCSCLVNWQIVLRNYLSPSTSHLTANSRINWYLMCGNWFFDPAWPSAFACKPWHLPQILALVLRYMPSGDVAASSGEKLIKTSGCVILLQVIAMTFLQCMARRTRYVHMMWGPTGRVHQYSSRLSLERHSQYITYCLVYQNSHDGRVVLGC